MRIAKLLLIYIFLAFYTICCPTYENEEKELISCHQIVQMEIETYSELFEEFIPMTTKLVLMTAVIMAAIEVSFRKEFRSPVVKPAFWGAKHRYQTPRCNLTNEHAFDII